MTSTFSRLTRKGRAHLEYPVWAYLILLAIMTGNGIGLLKISAFFVLALTFT